MQSSKFKVQNYKKVFFLLLFLFSVLIHAHQDVFAQTVDYQSWQSGATGMQAQSKTFWKALNGSVGRNTTAGLGFMVGTDTNPFLMVRGGVSSAGWGRLSGYTGIDLGEIIIPGQADFSLASQNADWSSNHLTFNNGSTDLNMWVSQLTPAVLLQQTNANNLSLFTGQVYQTFQNANGAISDNPTLGTVTFKYMAYRQAGTIQIVPLSDTPLSIPANSDPWILLWFGTNSHFVNTEIPLYDLPQSQAYKGDVPILIHFQNKPTSIQNVAEGGIQLDFSQAPGYMSLTPLYGRDILKASDTEGWGTSQSLLSETQNRINQWNDYACQFPTAVTENYGYNQTADTTTVTETFTFLPVCSDSNKTFATLPPVLGIAKDAMKVSFSGGVVDTKLATEFGSVMGIENTNSYTWSVQGLSRYLNSQKILLNEKQPDLHIVTELENEVQKVLDAGPLAPWIFSDEIPRHYYRGWIYFLNPADIVDTLLQLLPVLSEPQKTQVEQYIENYYINNSNTTHNVATSYEIPLREGTQRTGFALENTDYATLWEQSSNYDIYDEYYPLYNLYALTKYYDYKSQLVPTSVVTKANEALDHEFSEQNWATMYWFNGYEN